jgi:hypothetical protein
MENTKNDSIKEALDNILEQDLEGMRNAFSAAITERAVDKLEEKKVEIAQSYFGKDK